MLKYLADSVIQIATVMLLIGMILGYVKTAYGVLAGKRMLISVGAGVVFAGAMAILKTYTNLIDTGGWNLRLFAISLGAFILFIVFTAIKKVLGKLKVLLPCLMLSVIIAIQMLYSYADFFVYPHTIMLTEDSVVSTVFLTKMAGVVVGFLITLVFCFAAHRSFQKLKAKEAFVFTAIAILIPTLRQIAASLSTMLTRRIIPSNHVIFVITKNAANYSNFFIYALMAVLVVVAVVLLVRSGHVNEPYNNPAQRRKIVFKWKMIRRWSVTAMISIVAAVCVMTVIYSIANKPVELSPIEECEIVDDCLYIPFEQVEDGHLHRFGYTTDDGTVVRVIVIKKPNSSAYGIGLDACDICGETGYYEKDGEVICNKCDVVMNINTIGYKGGCNPIPLSYTVEDGQMIFSLADIVNAEKEFR